MSTRSLDLVEVHLTNWCVINNWLYRVGIFGRKGKGPVFVHGPVKIEPMKRPKRSILFYDCKFDCEEQKDE